MDNKFFYLYLVAGTTALILLFCQVYMPHTAAIDMVKIYAYTFAAGILYYMAFKTYHIKNDKELM